MDIIMPNNKEIKYVGFISGRRGKEVVGTDGEFYYFGPFLFPQLDYLEEYYRIPVTSLEEFEESEGVTVAKIDLKEECEKRLNYILNDPKVIERDGRYHTVGKTESVWGDISFDVTCTVDKLKEYIKNN